MTVRVRFFASLAEVTGCREERIEVAPGDRVAELWAALGQRHAGLREVPFRPLVACDRTYAHWQTALDGVGEVAFLPPVSGG